MSSFRNVCFTPAEFANIAGLEKADILSLETDNQLILTKRRIGNIDRKVISLEAAQKFFQGRRGDLVYRPHQKIQMFYNVKGGTGKSTLSAQFAMQCSIMGFRVLTIDLDGQGHLTLNLDLLDAYERPTIYDVLINDLPIQEAIVSLAPGLDIVPANLGLCNVEIPLNSKLRREYRLSDAIQSITQEYDLIIADTNPAASILNSSMIIAADAINIVCATNPLSFHGMSLVMATIEEMQREFKRHPEIKIIPNMYDNREVISQEVLGELKAQFEKYCTQTVVNRSSDLNEATKRRATVWEVNSKGTGAHDIKALSHELLNRRYVCQK